MQRTRIGMTLIGCFLASTLVGCMPRMTLAEMKEMMPKKPAELEHLNAFVGKWEGTGEVKFAMLDEPTPLKMTGRSESKWSGDGWYVVEESHMTMDGFDPMHSLGTWTYDSGAKKYRSTWVDSMGSTGIGEATRDPKTGEWKWSARSNSAWGESKMTGTIRFIDKDTMEWNMAEHMGFSKTAEFKGTSRRIR